jgi:hypothetical protein
MLSVIRDVRALIMLITEAIFYIFKYTSSLYYYKVFTFINDHSNLQIGRVCSKGAAILPLIDFVNIIISTLLVAKIKRSESIVNLE